MLKCEESNETSTDFSQSSETTPTRSAILRSQLFTRLYESATEGDFEGVKKAINEGANINEVFGEGSVLFNFCLWGDTKAIRWLVEKKADVNVLGQSDATCLMMLYQQKVHDSQQSREELDREFLDTALFLINSGIDVNAWSSIHTFDRGGSGKFRGRTALHVAAMKFQEPYCRLLIQNKADVHMVPSWNSWRGRNCLHWACLAPYKGESSKSIKKVSMVWEKDTPCWSTRSVNYLRFLILNGLDVDVQDFDGKTALCLAAERGWLGGVRALIETPMPSKVSLRSTTIAVIMQAGSKWGLVNVVAQVIVDFLIRVSADPTIDSNKPFRLVYLKPCLEFSERNRFLNAEDESDEEEEEKELAVPEKIKSMIALEEENAKNASIDHLNSNSGDIVQELQDELAITKEFAKNDNASQEQNNDVLLVISVSSHSSSSSSLNEVGQEFITRKFNHDWDETFDDGTPLGIARANNHVDIIEYLIRIL